MLNETFDMIFKGSFYFLLCRYAHMKISVINSHRNWVNKFKSNGY